MASPLSYLGRKKPKFATWNAGVTTSVLIKRSHPHSTHVHGDFLLQLTTHFAATLTGCEWPWRQLVWACLTAYLVHSQGPGSSLFPKTKQQPHLGLYRWACYLCSMARGVASGLLAAGSIIISHGRSTTGLGTAEASIPRGADFAWLKLDSQKYSPAFGQQGHSLLYLFPYLEWKDNLAVPYLTTAWFKQLIALTTRAIRVQYSSSPLAHICDVRKFAMMIVVIITWWLLLASCEWTDDLNLNIRWLEYYQMKNTIVNIQLIAKHLC